jgi:diacylglycerol kinase (ATP)
MRQPLRKSFQHAFDGIVDTVRDERNIKIHIMVMALVIIFGIIYKITYEEWLICLMLFALVISLEIVNTAIEAVVDLASPEYHPLAKRAKDCAAGAVLIAAILLPLLDY